MDRCREEPKRSAAMKEDAMTTRETVEAYFQRLASGGRWQEWLAESIEFTSFSSPVKRVVGKGAARPPVREEQHMRR
jgi:hypothetical protein